MRQLNSQDSVMTRVPEARYAYYRRCQVFREGGEQCKAPAEKGALICHAHAGQLATAMRRERERRVVLTEAVAEMRRRGKPEFEMKDLFMDFKGIQVTIAVMARALIDGRIECKTAGRLVVELQMFSKLLWMAHRKGIKTPPLMNTDDIDQKEEWARANARSANMELRKQPPQAKIGFVSAAGREEPGSPQIYADQRRLNGENASTTTVLTRTKTEEHGVERKEKAVASWARHRRKETRIAMVAKVLAFGGSRSWAHGPPERASAA
jgi:hypothetical protein